MGGPSGADDEFGGHRACEDPCFRTTDSRHLMYTTILLDFDLTLFDGDAAEAAAFATATQAHGIDPSEDLYRSYQTGI